MTQHGAHNRTRCDVTFFSFYPSRAPHDVCSAPLRYSGSAYYVALAVGNQTAAVWEMGD